MIRQLKKMTAGLLAVGLLATGVAAGTTAYAADSELGAAGVQSGKDYTTEEMLAFAIEDEYLAQAEYAAIMNSFGEQRPFSNIIRAEATHISLLTPLLETYKVTVPDTDWSSIATAPSSIEDAYAAGITAEKNNIAMYESFLKKELPADVKEIFEYLLNASENHLAAFQRQSDGTCLANGTGSMNGRGNGGCGMSGGRNAGSNDSGRGNQSCGQGSCILQ